MYNLKISKKQAKVISKALDFYSRIGCGQMSEVLWHPSVAKKMWVKNDKLTENQYNHKVVGQLLDNIKKIIWNYDPNEHGGINMADENDKVSYDLHQVIRHKLAWDKEPKGGMTVDFHKPMQYSEEEKLAEIKTESGAPHDVHGFFEDKPKNNKCPCGGYMNDWHSHASDCIVINKKGKQY